MRPGHAAEGDHRQRQLEGGGQRSGREVALHACTVVHSLGESDRGVERRGIKGGQRGLGSMHGGLGLRRRPEGDVAAVRRSRR